MPHATPTRTVGSTLGGVASPVAMSVETMAIGHSLCLGWMEQRLEHRYGSIGCLWIGRGGLPRRSALIPRTLATHRLQSGACSIEDRPSLIPSPVNKLRVVSGWVGVSEPNQAIEAELAQVHQQIQNLHQRFPGLQRTSR